jgi:hypothetical protein
MVSLKEAVTSCSSRKGVVVRFGTYTNRGVCPSHSQSPIGWGGRWQLQLLLILQCCCFAFPSYCSEPPRDGAATPLQAAPRPLTLEIAMISVCEIGAVGFLERSMRA